jgi:protein-L-isoaspartate(D-aspartate) O-methyltransferase
MNRRPHRHHEEAEPSDFTKERERMVRHQIASRGVRSTLVLDAMRKVPRERFLPEGEAPFAYDDSPLPIAAGQTISQPYIVAYMIDSMELERGDRVLEIGTGSGYAAAVLAEMGCEVYTVERIEKLALQAQVVLDKLGYGAVHVLHADGTLGWPDAAPFDGIVVAAGAPDVPEALKEQLAIGGRLVIPVGSSLGFQELLRVTRTGDAAFETDYLCGVRFVPLLGEQGWGGGGAID